MIQRLLDGGISDQDEVTEFEVVLDDGGGMLLFETDCGVDIGGKCCQVGPMFLQGNSMLSNEVCGGKRGVGWRKKIGCFSYVKGQKWMCASCCKIWGTAHTLADCD